MVRLPEKGADEHEQAQGQGYGASANGLPTLAALSNEVKELVRLISATDINELHLESGAVRIVIKRGGTFGAPLQGTATPAYALPAVYTPPPTLAAPDRSDSVNLIGHSPTHGDEVALAEGEELIVAPMVGTFYAAPAPNEPPYVSEGLEIEPSTVVGIIEAMKMMNEIEAEVGGRIVRILAQNAQPVEYGQPLMVVATNG
jgi:acetyl-CoA carboxylase biotin carboxyl carrier protein